MSQFLATIPLPRQHTTGSKGCHGPTVTKRGVRYPFYVCSALLRGRKSEAGSVPRVSATEIDAAVITTAPQPLPA